MHDASAPDLPEPARDKRVAQDDNASAGGASAPPEARANPPAEGAQHVGERDWGWLGLLGLLGLVGLRGALRRPLLPTPARTPPARPSRLAANERRVRVYEVPS